MDALATIGSREAKELLRSVAEGKIEIRQLDDKERREIESPPSDRQSESSPEQDVTDAEHAKEKLRSR